MKSSDEYADADRETVTGEYRAGEPEASAGAAKHVLPYGRQSGGRLLPLKREMSGATFIVLSVVAGLIGFFSAVGVIITIFSSEMRNEWPERDRMIVRLIFAGTGAVASIFSFVAARSARRRLSRAADGYGADAGERGGSEL